MAIAAPGDGDGFWAGAPSAVIAADGTTWLAYRLRRPVGEGRGYAVGIARSDDGVTFSEVTRLHREAFECDSLERPALVERPDGGWRIYLSLATPGTLHWSVVAIDADEPVRFDPLDAVPVLDDVPGRALKDVVVHTDGQSWEMWVCLHEVADPSRADAMSTLHATSDDGLHWAMTSTAMEPDDSSTWDARGTRVASVFEVGGERFAFYDGRASASENWEERTGLAVESDDGMFVPMVGVEPIESSWASRSLRYLDLVDAPGGFRLYYESARADGAHDLLTEYSPLPSGASQSRKSRPVRSLNRSMSSTK